MTTHKLLEIYDGITEDWASEESDCLNVITSFYEKDDHLLIDDVRFSGNTIRISVYYSNKEEWIKYTSKLLMEFQNVKAEECEVKEGSIYKYHLQFTVDMRNRTIFIKLEEPKDIRE